MPEFEGVAGTVYYRHWSAPAPKAKVVFLHGYGEHSGLYHRFGAFLNARGIDVWAPDAIGHGLSDGERGNPGSLADLRLNAEGLMKVTATVHSTLPMVLVGHSMGAMTAADLATQNPGPRCGVVLTGIPLEELTSEQQQAVTTGIISQDPFYLEELECDPLKFDMSDAMRRIAWVLSPEARDRIQIGLRSLSIPALLLQR
jgi:pimeloyl-ACP methyl ester carboxylesterase